jgi:hypothetical protein
MPPWRLEFMGREIKSRQGGKLKKIDGKWIKFRSVGMFLIRMYSFISGYEIEHSAQKNVTSGCAYLGTNFMQRYV